MAPTRGKNYGSVRIPDGFYVYALASPAGKIFYVGKGAGGRIHDHEAEARGSCLCEKCEHIRAIWRSGKDIRKTIIFDTKDEQEALDYECQTIAEIGRKGLFNRTNGGGGIQYGRQRNRGPSPREIRRMEREECEQLANEVPEQYKYYLLHMLKQKGIQEVRNTAWRIQERQRILKWYRDNNTPLPPDLDRYYPEY